MFPIPIPILIDGSAVHTLDKSTIIAVIALTVLAIAAIAVPIAYHLFDRDIFLDISKAARSISSFSWAKWFASRCSCIDKAAMFVDADIESSRDIKSAPDSSTPNENVQRETRTRKL